MTVTSLTGTHGVNTWVTSEPIPFVLTEKGRDAVASTIIGVEQVKPCKDKSCNQPRVRVTMRREDGSEYWYVTHDDGSFMAWTGGLGE